MNRTFGQRIKGARADKGYSQRSLSMLTGLDHTYLSKLENDQASYAPREDAIQSLAKHLDLDPDELTFLAGRVPKHFEGVLKRNAQSLPRLFRAMENQNQ